MRTSPSFLRLFTGGFVAGVVALIALQPADAIRELTQRFHLESLR